MTARFCLVKMTAGLFKSPGGHFFRFYCCQSQSNSQKQMHSGRDRIKNKIKNKKIKKHLHFEKKDDILMELTKTAENKTENDAWLSLVERSVRDREVAGSNPVASIPWQGRVEKSGKIFGFFLFYK